MSEDGLPSESFCRRLAQGQVEGIWKRQPQDVGNLESLLATCVHWEAPGIV